MKRISSFLISILLSIAFAQNSYSGETKPAAKAPPEFEAIKSLQGHWTAEVDMNGQKETVKAIYKPTSGGSAVESTIYAGSPKEMVSMYFLDGSKLMMTHYCMLGNQPRMKLTQFIPGKSLKFEMADATGMATPNDPHMGGLTVILKDKDHMTEEWVMFSPDGKKEAHAFNYIREK